MTQQKNELMTRSLEEELQHSKADAQETLTALLQFAEGVRAITRHMQSATTSNYDSSKSSSTEEKEEEKEDSKSDDDTPSPPLSAMVVSPESLVADTCLEGTVFGTDLVRLLDTAHHIRDYARLVSEESSVSAHDVLQAQQTAQSALQRAFKAESLARNLAHKTITLQRRVQQLEAEKKVLAKEVKSLRQYVATARQTDMERLLQQHVVGALLLHEGQLKQAAAAAAQQSLTKRQRQVEEEKKEDDAEDYDLELVRVEDCQSEGRLTPTQEDSLAAVEPTASESATTAAESKSTTEDDDVTSAPNPTSSSNSSNSNNDDTPSSEDKKDQSSPVPETMDTATKDEKSAFQKVTSPVRNEQKVLADATKTAIAAKGKDKNASPAGHEVAKDDKQKLAVANNKENCVTAANQSNNKSSTSSSTTDAAKAKTPSSHDVGTVSVAASYYTPIKLYPGFGGRQSPVPPSSQQQQQQQTASSLSAAAAATDKPSSSRSISSSSSQPARPPAVEREHVGSKVFNFLFHPEKIGQQQREAQEQQQQLQQLQQPQSDITQKQNVPLPKTKKLNPLLKLDDFLFGATDDDEKNSAVSVDGTVPTIAATTPASSCAASRVRALTRDGKPNNKKNNHSCTQQQHQQQQSPRIIPNCVSFSDNVSVESNLNSPSFQPSPKTAKVTRTIVDVDEIIAAANNKALKKQPGDVELYKDLKVFQSLAIPTEDEIDDYHEYHDQQQLLLQRQPQPSYETPSSNEPL